MLCHCACKHVRLSCVLNKLLTYLLTNVCIFVCVMLDMMVLARCVGAETQLQRVIAG